MQAADPFSTRYEEFLDGTYDCVDRIVLNGYYHFLQSGGGFRTWWRQLHGTDDSLDNAHLMRFAGRFARRVRAAAEQLGIPIIEKKPRDRMHEIAEAHRPADPHRQGVFCITVHRAPNSVWGVVGTKNLRRKQPQPYVNHFAFHIQDSVWGHITIKVCPHPPFNVQVTLNGHEYVARRALRENIPFTKEGNCFTNSANLADLDRVAVTLRSTSAIGPLKEVCERWLYSACLCFLLPLAEQKRMRVRYDWSIYQMEYSRNLLFCRGRVMEEIFQSVIDRTRGVLNVQTVKTIFGRKHRPYFKQGKEPRFEVEVERPTYDLTVFKVHYGLMTVKMYTKGACVLRIEAIVHNAKKEFDRYRLECFPKIAEALRLIVERFLAVLRSVEACWVTDETLEQLPEPSQVGAARVAGVDLNRPRTRAVLMAVLALSSRVREFRVEQLACSVTEILGRPYGPRQASYDLKKLRGKGLIEKLKGTRRYECPADSLRTIMAVVVLREKVIKPILAGTVTRRRGRPPKNRDLIDQHYEAIRSQMEQLLQEAGIAI
jgi:hypothetical protein